VGRRRREGRKEDQSAAAGVDAGVSRRRQYSSDLRVMKEALRRGGDRDKRSGDHRARVVL
jgi:hypothetical protein